MVDEREKFSSKTIKDLKGMSKEFPGSFKGYFFFIPTQ